MRCRSASVSSLPSPSWARKTSFLLIDRSLATLVATFRFAAFLSIVLQEIVLERVLVIEEAASNARYRFNPVLGVRVLFRVEARVFAATALKWRPVPSHSRQGSLSNRYRRPSQFLQSLKPCRSSSIRFAMSSSRALWIFIASYLALPHDGPLLMSASKGTPMSLGNGCSIHSRMRPFTMSTHSLGHSPTISSCTCRHIM